MSNPYGPKIPVIVITGFLGSGKTTLLNHLVRQPELQATAVVINEFGEIGVDHLLVETSTESMIELNNGCICCTIRGDLSDKLGSLAMWMDAGRIPAVDRVIVETTGLADPAPILHTLMTDEALLDRFCLGSVLTVVDALLGGATLDRFPEATKQIALADDVVVSKLDLVEAEAGEPGREIVERIRALNPTARIHAASHGEIDPAIIVRGDEQDVETAFARFSSLLRSATDHERDHETSCGDGSGHRHEHRDATHVAGITSFVVRLDEPVGGRALNDLLQEIAREFGPHLLRVKGIVQVAEAPERPAVIQGVQHVFFPVSWLDRWPDGERSSKLVFITQGLESHAIRERFSACFAVG